MSKQDLTLKAGKLVVFSEGAYSDYGYRGAYVVLRDFSHDEVKAIERRILADNSISPRLKQGSVEPALIREGVLAEIDLREIHLGQYDLELR